jgi:hypothetical protein
MDPTTQTLLTVFIVVTAVAVVIQMGILVALFLSLRKTSARVESLADAVEKRALPTLEAAHAVLNDSRGRITESVANVAAITSSLRSLADRFDATFSDTLDRTRRQVIRTDDMVSRALDHVEETTEVLHEGIIGPVRRLTGVVQGLTVGIDTFFKLTRKYPRREHTPAVSHDEELFI